VTLPRYGINVKFVDPTDLENFKTAITNKTKAVYGEIIGNPGLQVLDVEAVSEIAHESGVPLIIDNTFATPHVCKPLQLGADIVVHSATKWIGGHGTSIGGVIVDGGRFNWNTEKFPEFTEPDASYNGIRYAIDFGTLAFITKVRVQLLRDFGAALSPQNAFQLIQGLETLHIRVERHNENAARLAENLENHPAVEWVSYPGLESHPSHGLAKEIFNNGFGSIIVFGIKGGKEAGKDLINNVSLWSHVANVGDAKSLIIHPASTTHQQLTKEQLEETGVTESLVRLSVGIESLRDIQNDLDQALIKATGIGEGEGKSVLINDEGVIRWALNSATERVLENGQEITRQKTLAIVGLSGKEARPSYRLARKMQRLGYKVIPVNPRETEILGEKAYPDLKSVPYPIDVVQVFRTPEAAIGVAKETVEVNPKPKIFWLQEGVISPEAAEIASKAGIPVVYNRCTYKEAQRLRGTISTYACEL